MANRKRKRRQGQGHAARVVEPAGAAPFTRPDWSDALCLLVALLMYVTVARGLLYYATLIQLPLLVGVFAGLIASARINAAAIAGTAAMAGLLALPPFEIARATGGSSLALSAAVVAGSAAAAYAARWALEGVGDRFRTVVPWVIVGLLTVNLWASVITLDARIVTQDGRSGADMLGESPVVGELWSDEDFYRRVLWLMTHEEVGFYDAFQQGYQENTRWQRDPNTVLAVRLPTAFVMWAALPGKPWSLIVGYLALASVAAGAVAWMAARRASLAFALPAIAALYGVSMFVATTPVIVMSEPWAALLAVISLSAAVLSFRHDRWKALQVASVLAAVAAVGIRELMVYLFVAGIASALVCMPERRAFRVTTWLSGFAAVVVGYVLHALAASAIVVPTGAVSQWFNGGLGNLVLGLEYAADYIGGTALVPAAFGVLALVGAATSKLREERLFLALCCALPLVGFLAVGSDAVEVYEGQVVHEQAMNYWGMIVVPVLFAVSPLGIARIFSWAQPASEDTRATR